MRDHYQGFDHPVLADLPTVPTTDFFTEMDEVADELRSNPKHVEIDDEIAFLKLLKFRGSKLTQRQRLDLRAEWRDHYRAQQEMRAAARRARVAELLEERDVLFAERASSPPDERVAHIDARLAEVARKLAAAIF